MALEMVINEHSLQEASDEHEARTWMKQFVKTIQKAADQYKVSRSLRMNRDIFDATLASNYHFRQWLNEKKGDPMRGYLRRLIDRKLPPWEDLPDLDGEVMRYEFYHPGFTHKAPEICGLWVSHRLKALAISLPSSKWWDSKYLDLNVQWMEEDEDSKINQETVKIIHASRPKHVCEHAKWIEKRHRNDIQDGDALWNRRAALFPSLSFCAETEKQIQGLEKNKLRLVLHQLSDLETYCRGWKTGGFTGDNLLGNPHREGEATRNKYGYKRIFLCPDGKHRFFSWHTRITQDWRLYFIPISDLERGKTGKMIIGYVGPHLPTKKYKL